MNERRRVGLPLVALAAALLLLAACNGDSPSVLDPRSEAAERVESNWWVMFWISAVVVAVVISFIVAAAVRSRSRPDGGDRRGDRQAGGAVG